MREILFKGKNVDNDEWVEGFYFMQWNFDTEKSEHYIKAWGTDLTIHSESIGQWINAFDKNGKKIFEDDVVNYNNTLYVVKYISQYCRFAGVNKHAVCAVFNFAKAEIVGNIHDNPELLEVVKCNG